MSILEIESMSAGILSPLSLSLSFPCSPEQEARGKKVADEMQEPHWKRGKQNAGLAGWADALREAKKVGASGHVQPTFHSAPGTQGRKGHPSLSWPGCAGSPAARRLF